LKGRHRRKALEDPKTFNPDKLKEPQRNALGRFWGAWLDELESIRIVDPACGSGAFLIEAFDQMLAEYETTETRLKDLG
jgi:type II restriction/modification system DNA methylase subunit YeeA